MDPDDDDRATEIKLCGDFSRPHMRAFHFSWLGYINAFILWFAISPLLPEIQATLKLSKEEVWTSNIIAVSGSAFLRVALGPFVDKYGARIPMGILLMLSSIPTACLGLVNNATGLYIVRFFIGLAGAIFVMTISWCTRMFSKNVVGTANAFAAGWGNLGAGVTTLLVGSILFPLFKLGMSPELAWRTVCLVPAFISFISAILIIKYSDDCPKGDYAEMKKNGTFVLPSARTSIWLGAKNFNTWLMFIQYACCFGVEITIAKSATMYYHDEFGLKTERAAAIASICGFMNIFSRGLGGYLSDRMNLKWSMKGRLWLQAIFLFVEGLLIIAFIHAKSLGVSIFTFTLFSLFAEMLCGTSFGIAPYLDATAAGSIAGIIGAGGNVGAVGFSLLFRNMDQYWAFITMGIVVIFSSFTCLVMYIPGYGGILFSSSESDTAVKSQESEEGTDDSVASGSNSNIVISESSEDESAKYTTLKEVNQKCREHTDNI